MDAPLTSILLLFGAVAATVAVGRVYFHRVRVERPPVGVFNLRDVSFTFVVLVVIPPLYLHLPRWLVGAILVLTGSGLAYLTLTSALGRRAAVPLAAVLTATEIGLTATGRGQSGMFVAVNDLAVGLLVVGVCNIWAQSGIRARDVAVFAAAVAVYDLVATGLLPLMVEFFTRVQSLPFAPTMAVGRGSAALGLGMGDLLFALLWPLVAEKAFSRRAGLAALAGTVGCLFAIDAAFYLDLLNRAVPAMVFLGPVILLQYRWLRRRYPAERSTGQYEAATRPGPLLPGPPVVPLADLAAALALHAALHAADPDRPTRQRYLAVHSAAVLASGTDPGEAVRSARRTAPGAIPVLVLAIPPRQPAEEAAG